MQHPARWLSSAAAATIVFATMWLGYRLRWSWLGAFDRWALDPLYAFGAQRQGWVTFWDVFCTVFGPTGFRLLGAAVIIVALVQRNVRAAVFVLVTVELSGVATQVGKFLVDRPRPDGALAHATSSAFPSGHAVGVMAAVLALLTVSAGLFGPRARLLTVVSGVAIVVAVGVGRVVLVVHHPSDVLAGWALGYLWFLLGLLLIRPPPLQRTRSDSLSGEATDEKLEAPGSGR